METIIVIGIIGMILPVIFSIIFSIIRQQTKVYVLSVVKREGDNALNVIENSIRNKAVSIHSAIPDTTNEVCKGLSLQHPASGTSNGSDFYFSDSEGQYFRFMLTNNEIASSSSIANASVDLTSDVNTRITDFDISCLQTNVQSAPIVDIHFKIEQKQSLSQRAEDVAALDYSTKVKLRTF